MRAIDDRLLESRMTEIEPARAWSPRVISKFETLIRSGDDRSLLSAAASGGRTDVSRPMGSGPEQAMRRARAQVLAAGFIGHRKRTLYQVHRQRRPHQDRAVGKLICRS